MKLIRNIKIYDYNNYIDDGYIIFDEKIIEVGHMRDFTLANFKGVIIEGRGKLLIPGLINFHAHIYSTLVRGCPIDMNPVTFKDILTQLWWRFDKAINNEATYYSGLVFGIESIKSGVTSLFDHHASGLEIEGSLEELRAAICSELGMRGVFAFETSDRFDLDVCIKENLQGIEWSETDCRGMFGLHASLSLSDSSLDKVAQVLGKTPIHIHVGESVEDQLDAIQKYDKTVVERLDQYQLLNTKSILAHSLHISERECELIKNKGAYVALNPTSNLNNAVGIFNLDMYREHKIPLLIGTDGLGVNVGKEWTNLYYIGKGKLQNPMAISLLEIKTYIEKSYEYASDIFDTPVGRLEKGFVSDFILLDYKNPTTMDQSNAFAHLFYGLLDNIKPSDVWIKGKDIIRDYKSFYDEDRIYKEAKIVSEELWERIGG